jgi:hypothetical protein
MAILVSLDSPYLHTSFDTDTGEMYNFVFTLRIKQTMTHTFLSTRTEFGDFAKLS